MNDSLTSLRTEIQLAIRDIPDFPAPGILFKDITPVLADPGLLVRTTDAMARPFLGQGITRVAAIESRGFLFGAPIACALGAGLVPLRKPGKLPFETIREDYQLEYGSDALEMHVDAVERGARVLIVDDVLATGGTAAAAGRLIECAGGVVAGISVLLSISALNGEKLIAGRKLSVLINC
jgi:adenine phosphoribosyltransferase